MCSANQTCVAATGACVCDDAINAAVCGTPPQAGDLCTTPSGTSHASCIQGADGCFTVTEAVACVGNRTCTAPKRTVVAVGEACGCPPIVTDLPTGSMIKLLGTGCTQAQVVAGARVGSPADDAVLACRLDGPDSCPTWQLSVACAAQQLTGGIDPMTSLPACVCRDQARWTVDHDSAPPADRIAMQKPGQFFVDPNPTMATFMTGAPTGAQFPAACRHRTLTTALAHPIVSQVTAQHETSSNVHFVTHAGLTTVVSCDAPDSCEKFPIVVPAGVTLDTSDVGSFNPAHYVIDVDASDEPYAMLLNDGATLAGYTLDGSGSHPGGLNAAVGVVALLVSPAPQASAATAALHQILVLASRQLPTQQIAVLVRGHAQWKADYLSIIGGSGTAIGILLDHASDDRHGGVASLAATHLDIELTGGVGAVGVQVGTAGAGNGLDAPGASESDVSNALTITNDRLDSGAGSLRRLAVGPYGSGVRVHQGDVTITGVTVGSTAGAASPGPLTGYEILAPGTATSPTTVRINQGTVVCAPANGGVGVLAQGGHAILTGTHITGIQGTGGADLPWTGVVVASSTPDSAGDVIIAGTAPGEPGTVIDTAPLVGATNTSAIGIRVGTGSEDASYTALARLTIGDHTLIGGIGAGFRDGIVVANGRLLAEGTDVSVSDHWRDGIQLMGQVNPGNLADPLGRVRLVGTTLKRNGRLGLWVNNRVPVVLDQLRVLENGTAQQPTTTLTDAPVGGGIEVQQTQGSTEDSTLFRLLNSRIANNHGCGVAVTGGDSLVAGGSKRVCGVGPMTGPGFATSGGKVSVALEDNDVSGNLGVGIYVSESPDDADPGDDHDVTEVILQRNTVRGNLTAVFDEIEPLAGGIYFAASDADGATPTMSAERLACAGPPPAACTRVRAERIVGNTIACNGRHELGFGIPQRTESNDGVAWNIGSAAGSVDMALACSPTAFPNTLAGYGASGSDLGLAVATGIIHVDAVGVHWARAVPAAGLDYSEALGLIPLGNGDSAPPGSGPEALPPPAQGFVFCPARAMACSSAD